MEQSGTRSTIEPLDETFADLLKQPRDAYVSHYPDRLTIRQTGAAYVGDRLEIPTTPYGMTNGQTAIETFVVRSESPVVPTGNDQDLIALWQPPAQRMADQVLSACARFGIEVVEPGYLTVSALPLDLVSHEPHFDDDQYMPSDGVGLVAIAADHSGTRTTTMPIEVPPIPAGAPISLPADLQASFESGLHPSTESEPERIVVLPQFGQLHSGPVLTDLDPHILRTLYVLRLRTAGERLSLPGRRRQPRRDLR